MTTAQFMKMQMPGFSRPGLRSDGVAPIVQVGGLLEGAVALYLPVVEGRNLLKYSQQFNNTVWGNSGCTITPNAAIAPDGTETADLCVPNATSEWHRLIYMTLPVAMFQDYETVTLSVYLKSAGYNNFTLRLLKKDNATVAGGTVNLSTGTIGSFVFGATGTVESVGNDWYRCSITVNVGAGAASNLVVYLQFGTDQFLGDGVKGAYLWGAQLEQGSVPTTYYPTTDKQVLTDYSGNGYDGVLGAAGAAPTWTAEGLSFDGGDTVALGDPSEMLNAGVTIQAVVKPGADVTTRQAVVYCGDKSAQIVIRNGKLLLYAGGTTDGKYLYSATGSVAASTWVDLAGTIEWGGDIKTYINGAPSTTGTTSAASNTSGNVNQTIGSAGSGSHRLTGSIAAAVIYPFALTPTQVSQNHNALRNTLIPRGVTIPFDYGGGSTANLLPPVILLQFDDGRSSVYDTAYPILTAAGLKATVWACSNDVGAIDQMPAEELVALDAAGWDIGNHAQTHLELATLTQAQAAAEIAHCRDYLDGLGLTRASHHLCYPRGSYNSETIAAAQAEGMLTARTTVNARCTIPITAPYEMPRSASLGPGVSLAYANALVGTTTAGPQEIITICTHDVDDTGSSNSWSPENLTALCATINALGLRCVTISELYAYIQNGYVWP